MRPRMRPVLAACLVLAGPVAQMGSAGQATLADAQAFVDVSRDAGLSWGITRTARGLWNLVETMGGGGGFADIDGDGLLDIYLVAYSREPQQAGGQAASDVVYRNNGDGTFSDVTVQAGISSTARGMGLAVGDYDGDGDTDLYVTGHAESRLYRNDGRGRFEDVTAAARVANSRWATSAVFADFDSDGDQDLFVANYLDFNPRTHTGAPCQMIDDVPFCSIDQFQGSPSTLFRNEGDGTFTDVSVSSGIAPHVGKGLGVVTADFDLDGRLDIFQANDTVRNFLFRNLGQGRFEEIGLDAGVAYDASGRALGAMGVDVHDVNGDGRLDVFVTNFTNQPNSLFQNQGEGTFLEVAAALGLARPSVPRSGFGARFLDYDNDGRMELMVANGHPFEPVAKVWPGITFEEPAFLFEKGPHAYVDIAPASNVLSKPCSGRGLATGDYDNDGDVDVLYLCVGAAPRLLRNERGHHQGWLGVTLVAVSGRGAAGAVVRVTAGGRSHVRTLAGGGSYCSASDSRLIFGLGPVSVVERVEVVWPAGTSTVLRNVTGRRYVTVREAA